MSKKRTRAQRKADNIAAETQRRINEGDTSNYVQKQIANNPGKFENTERVAQKVAQKENKIQKSSDVKVSKEKKTKKSFSFGGREPDLTVDPDADKYNQPGQHKLSSQFVRLADKYYGGDQEAFAKTSQGQVLLNYLKDVPASRGGGRGLPDENILSKLEPLVDEIPLPWDVLAKDVTVEDLKTKNFPVAKIRDQPELGRYGPLTSDEYFKFTQMLENRYPEKFRRARPFASGALPELATKFIMSPVSTMAGGIYESLTGKKFGKQELDPIFTGEPLDPKLFYDLDEIEQSGLMGTEVAMNAQQDYDYNDPDDPDKDPPLGYDSWGEFYAASGIVEGTGGFGADGQYYFNYADGGIASLDNGQFDTAEADSLMFRDPVENDEWEYNV